MLENLSTYQRLAVYSLLAIGGLFFWSYISSALFFSLVELPESALKPWSIFEYYRDYSDNPAVLKKIIISAVIPPAMAAIMFLLTFFKTESLFGDARFAKGHEVTKAKLYGGKGILLGKRGNKFLSDDGTEHVLVYAPSRSGKGVGIVIPNLLNWDGSVLVLDIKLENFKATSGFREKHGHKTYLFNPADPEGKTHCFNPLMVIPDDPALRINEIQKISNFLAPNPLQGDPMWASEARKLFLATVLLLQDTGAQLTLGETYRFINGTSVEEIDELLAEHVDDLDPACISNFINYINMGEKQRSGVKSTLTSALDLFDNPLIDAATSKSDFSFSDLRKKKTSIYVGVTPNNLARLKPLLNLFFQQCIDQNTQSLPDKATEPHKILMLMDEFTSLGRMDIIKDGIAFFAGYHIRLMPIIQGPAQLADKYGEDGKRSMMTNFKYRVIFAPNDPKDAEEISRELGTKTVNQKSRSQGVWNAQNATNTTSKTGRALLLPQEVKQLSQKKEIIIIEAMPPIMASKIVYYDDKAFTNRFFNVFDPSKNTGPLPSETPTLDLASAMEARRASLALDTEPESGIEQTQEQPNTENGIEQNQEQAASQEPAQPKKAESDLFAGLDKLEGIGKRKGSSLVKKPALSDNEMNNLLTEFWNTGTAT